MKQWKSMLFPELDDFLKIIPKIYQFRGIFLFKYEKGIFMVEEIGEVSPVDYHKIVMLKYKTLTKANFFSKVDEETRKEMEEFILFLNAIEEVISIYVKLLKDEIFPNTKLFWDNFIEKIHSIYEKNKDDYLKDFAEKIYKEATKK